MIIQLLINYDHDDDQKQGNDDDDDDDDYIYDVDDTIGSGGEFTLLGATVMIIQFFIMMMIKNRVK